MLQLRHGGAKTISIQGHVANYRGQHLTMPAWQRKGQKIWESDYKSYLVESIMVRIDIPKIYLGTLRDTPDKTLIIDGGHRTRCLTEYMDNTFPWESGESKIYYSEVPKDLRNTRAMTVQERTHFDNYQLTLVCYQDISEKEARMIFNRLQNAAPMAMADIVNSYESDLVEFFREDIRPWLLRGNEDYKHLKGCPLKHPDTNEDLYQFLSWYTIINPNDSNDKTPEQNALEHIEMGKGREENECFRFLREFDDATLTSAKMSRFKDTLETIMRFLKENPKLNNCEIASLMYAMMYLPRFSTDRFVAFMGDVVRYKSLDSESNKQFKMGLGTLAIAKKTERDTLNTEYGGSIGTWQKSKLQHGMGIGNMVIRHALLKDYSVEEEQENAPYVDGNALESFVMPHVLVDIGAQRQPVT